MGYFDYGWLWLTIGIVAGFMACHMAQRAVFTKQRK